MKQALVKKVGGHRGTRSNTIGIDNTVRFVGRSNLFPSEFLVLMMMLSSDCVFSVSVGRSADVRRLDLLGRRMCDFADLLKRNWSF